MSATLLPKPRLELHEYGNIPVLTDNALADSIGVRVAFSGRAGGVSEGAYASLNLGGHVGDDAATVRENRARLLSALGGADATCVVPNQVHGTTLAVIPDDVPETLARESALASDGADGIVVGTSGVAALLSFADCAPLVIVSPTGRFAVVHAGWRGAVAGIAGRAVAALVDLDARAASAKAGGRAVGSAAANDAVKPAAGETALAGEGGVGAAAAGFNAYVGPFIHAECFETGVDVAARFAEAFGERCVPDERHVDLLAALRVDLQRAGLSSDRIVEAGVCTKCRSDDYFSYRASGGTCGRHGAVAFRVTEGGEA